MPVTVSYPGVYIEEIPSGVRTITGVSTSVAAFIGAARQGPINDATRLQSFADFERNFGGLDAGSEASYAVRQFFLNGGAEAWMVRIAKNASSAFLTLKNGASTPVDVLKITARNEGFSGNDIVVALDYGTAIPASTFNLTLSDGGDTEVFQNLSMNGKDARYVENIVNGASKLVKVERKHDLSGLGAGTSTGGVLGDVKDLVDAGHNQLRVSVNGYGPVDVQLDSSVINAEADAAARLAKLCELIQAKVRAEAGGSAALKYFKDFTCVAVNGNQIKMTSGDGGETSTVRILPGAANDVSARLKLGSVNGGTDADAVAAIRPNEAPDRGSLTSGSLQASLLAGATPPLPNATTRTFQITLDGDGPLDVDIGSAVAAGATIAEQAQDIAGRIQAAVRGLKPAKAAYGEFTCAVIAAGASKKLVLASGTRGSGSSVQVGVSGADTLATNLKLTGAAGALSAMGKKTTLEGGNEEPYTASDEYNLIIGDRSKREGIYALEAVDLFNILCLPGVADSGILSDAEAYCREKRAFFIIDAPAGSKSPSEMEATVTGAALPKSDHAAVYYPWITIGDPLKGGSPKTIAPCGAVAGLYARTDSNRGIWKAPAGVDAGLSGAQAVEYKLTDPQNGVLNPLGVNCIRGFPVYGAVVWGARTLRGNDQMASEWKYIPVRRLALYIEESLYRGSKWIVFEPNDEPLWAQIRLNAGAFMNTLFRQGAFQGSSPKESYLVKCDKETTTQDDINRGVVNIVVGFAPLKPAEFVIIKIQQLAGQIQT